MENKFAMMSLAVCSLFFVMRAPATAQITSVEPSSANVDTSVELTMTIEAEMSLDPQFLTVWFSPAWQITVGEIEGWGELNEFTFNIDIPAGTTPGLQDVHASYAGMTEYEGEGLFEVICVDCTSDPRLVGASPTTGVQGEQVQLTITGENTDFTNNPQLDFSPAGIQVQQLTALSDTSLEADISIDADATVGARSLTVTTDSGSVVGNDMFDVEARPIDDIVIDPNTGTQGNILATVTLTEGLAAYSTVTAVSLGSGVTIGSFSSPDDSSLVLTNVAIASDALVGHRDLSLTYPTGEQIFEDVFAVLQGVEANLIQIQPDHIDLGHPGLPVELIGQNTHFDAAEPTVSFSGSSLSVSDVLAVDSTHIQAQLHISDTTTIGGYDVTVQVNYNCDFMVPAPAPCELVTMADALAVTAPGSLDSADPPVLEPSTSPTIRLTATDGQFVQGSTQLSFDPPEGLEVTSITVLNSDSLDVTLNVAEDAPGDPRDVLAVTGPDIALGQQVIDIDRPEIRVVSPSSLFQGLMSQPVVVAGVDIPFDDETRVGLIFQDAADSSITISSTDFNPEEPDQITITISVPETAPLGPRDVTVTAGSVELTAENALTILAFPDDTDDKGCACGASAKGPQNLLMLFALLALIRRRNS